MQSIRYVASKVNVVHNASMRTTVALDDDVYELATLYAKGRGVTLGAAISELVRKGTETPRTESISPRLKRLPNGMLIFASQGKGRVITNEMVKEALEEDDY
jgi:hypothetical protein